MARSTSLIFGAGTGARCGLQATDALPGAIRRSQLDLDRVFFQYFVTCDSRVSVATIAFISAVGTAGASNNPVGKCSTNSRWEIAAGNLVHGRLRLINQLDRARVFSTTFACPMPSFNT
jgi:hypothetical protein